MATTTNFGWETPDDTDYVKDGAAAMRTLGNSIDASFVDLKGGTTGQVLSKNSNTDLDYVWVTQDDANAIQNTIVDAKGDVITATAADTPARLAVGTNGQVLTADSTTATGLKWATLTSAPTLNWQQFTASGTFSVPSGVTKVWVEVRGGGGGGGNVDGSYTGWNTWTGGGGGGVLKFEQVTVTSGGSVTVTIGGGGAGGSAGSTSSFGALSAAGGAVGGRLRNISGDAQGGPGAGNGGGAAGTSAAANTGAGGGGTYTSSGNGASGGSGIVTVFWAS